MIQKYQHLLTLLSIYALLLSFSSSFHLHSFPLVKHHVLYNIPDNEYLIPNPNSEKDSIVTANSSTSYDATSSTKINSITKNNDVRNNKNKKTSSVDPVRRPGVILPHGGLSPCNIKVVGVGGGGCNAVDRMLDYSSLGVEYCAINTDAQTLGRSAVKGAHALNIGVEVTKGLGAGGNPVVGEMAAEESRRDIRALLDGADLCFVTSGMGGGTGSGAAPIVAEIAKSEINALTIGIVTKPFRFEGTRRMQQAKHAINKFRQQVDTLICVSNDRLLEIIPDNTPMNQAFAVADDILRQGVVGITNIIVQPGLINVDFADVRSIMANSGPAMMGIGVANGKTAAEDAARAAVSSPLLESTIHNAKGVVFNICGGRDLALQDVNRAAHIIGESVLDDANIIFGALIDDEMKDNISITVLATGVGMEDDDPVEQEIEEMEYQSRVQEQQQQRKSRSTLLGRHNLEDSLRDEEPRIKSLFKKKKKPTKSVGKNYERENVGVNDVPSFWGDLGKGRKKEDKRDYW